MLWVASAQPFRGMCVCARVRLSVHGFVGTLRVNERAGVCVCVRVRAYLHTNVCLRVRVCMYTCVHVRVQVPCVPFVQDMLPQ